VVAEVELCPLGTSATNWPIVLATSDYEDGKFGGMMIDKKKNRSTRRKPAPVPFCPPQISHELTGREPGQPRWEASELSLELWLGQQTNFLFNHLKVVTCSSQRKLVDFQRITPRNMTVYRTLQLRYSLSFVS
jgi:hypothetical protein